MLKTESLILLVNSLSRSEKKTFSLSSKRYKKLPDYFVLYDLINRNKNIDPFELKNKFQSKCKDSSFDSSVKYLYDILLDSILTLKTEQDNYFLLLNKILKAKILFEKSLFEEGFSVLNNVITSSEKLENYYTLLFASKLELDQLLTLNFPEMNEKVLLNKQFRLSKVLRLIMKINEQSSIFELLKYRIIYKGNIRSEKQKLELNDLVVSEMSIMSSSNLENFEINKLHQLFQANYLISVGDYKSALRSFSELNRLFETNKQFWGKPPIYYLQTIEGVLDSLRGIKNYKGMDYFIEQLRKIESTSINFNANVNSLIFLYNLFPKLDSGDFLGAMNLLKTNINFLYNKLQLLNLTRQAELCLYAALVFFVNKDYKNAHKYINMIILLKGKEFYYIPLFRTIRLVNLMILHGLKDYDLIRYETRSIKREIKDSEKGYEIEKSMLRFVNMQNLPITERKRNVLWEKICKELELFRHDIFEQQVLKIFDFSAWIESKITKIPLSNILKNNYIET